MKTTKKDFARFCDEFTRWQKRLGLTDWRITFLHETLQNNLAAYCQTDIEGRVAWISLGYGCDNPIDQVARHEALGLLLSELWILGQYRWLRADELESARHAVIRRLENLFDDAEK